MSIPSPSPATSRRLECTADLDALDFTKMDGLVPVVAQDVDTGEMHFWSRSREALWRKGETSGNVLAVVSLHGDCDADTVLALVRPTGPACHTGETTCFGAGAEPVEGTLARLDATLEERAVERPEGSYTVKLLDDRNLRMKKLGEETAELVAALATSDGARATEEVADVIYHALVALRAEGIGLDAVLAELEKRAG